MPSRSKSHNNKKKQIKNNTKHGKSRSKLSRKHNSRKTLRTHKQKHNNKNQTQRGGFNSCSLATVQEPGLSIPAIGDVPGFSLGDSKGAIYRPNCKSDTYQAMAPA